MTPKLRIVFGIVAILIVAAVPLIALAQTATPMPGKAFVMVGNFSPDSPPVDIYINDQLIGDNLSFSQATFPVQVTAGSIYIVVRDAAAPVTDPPIVDGYKDVGENEYYMVPVMNIKQRAQFGAYLIPVYGPLAETETRVQFFHAVPEGPRLDVINATTDAKVVEAMGYVEDPSVVDNLVAGVYNWQVWTNYRVIFPGFEFDPNPAPDSLIIDMGQLDLKARVIYSFFVIGSPSSSPSVRALVLAMPYGGGQPVAPPSFPGSVGPTPTGPTRVPSRTPTPTRTPTPGPTGTATATPQATATPMPVVALSTNALSTDEGSSFSIAVQLDRIPGSTVTVKYASSNGTATAPSDYSAVSGTLIFAAGETVKTINVPIVNDTLDENDETFSLTLSSPSGATLGTASVTVTIEDNDPMPSVSITNSTVGGVGDTSIDEPATVGSYTEVTVTVELSTASGRTVTVDYQPADATLCPPNCATEGSDFNIVTQSNGTFRLTFNPGDTLKTFLVRVLNDGVSEPEERFFLRLRNLTNAREGTITWELTIPAN